MPSWKEIAEGLEKLRSLEHQLAMEKRQASELRAQNTELKLVNTRLERRIADLEMRVGSDSSNSGKPPSSDAPFDREAKRKARNKKKSDNKRKRGAQKGHKGSHRAQLSNVDRVMVYAPTVCTRCTGKLVSAGEIRRHQQTEFVGRGGIEVIEHQSPLMHCQRCGYRQRTRLPKEVRQHGAFGPRIRALLCVLVGSYRMSRRQVQRFIKETFGVVISLGAISYGEQKVSKTCKPVYDDAHAAAQSSAQAHAEWLWAMVTKSIAVYRIDPKRNLQAAAKLLGNFKGLLCSDDLGSYNSHGKERRQLCHAHLARHIQKHIDMACLNNSAQSESDLIIATRLQTLHRKMFKLWNRIRDGTVDDSKRRSVMGHVQDRFVATLEKGCKSAQPRFARFAKRQLDYTDMLWRFVLYRSEPTNNTAERALRHGVIWRKTSFGTQSERGNRFVERMLTIHHSLRLQGRNMFAFVTRVIDADARNLSLPSLRPGSNIG